MNKSTKQCRWYAIDLPGYLAGQLAPHEARLVELHLDECPECLEQMGRFRALDDLLIEHLAKPRSTPEFHAEFFRQLAAEAKTEAKRSPGARFQPWAWNTALVPATAAALAMAFVLFRSDPPVAADGQAAPAAQTAASALPASIKPVVAAEPDSAREPSSELQPAITPAVLVDYSIGSEVEGLQPVAASVGENG